MAEFEHQWNAFEANSAEITLATTTGIKELVTLFHPATEAKSYYVTFVEVFNSVAQTAGRAVFELQFITAEAGTPGGTQVTPQCISDRTASSAALVRSGVTAAPTTAGQVFARRGSTGTTAFQPHRVFEPTTFEDCIKLRGGQAEGIRFTANVMAAITGAPIYTVRVRWIEL
jgi:hypothetical protein